MIEYICDGCGKKSTIEEDMPLYTMFVCDSYSGEQVNLCLECEKKVKNIWEHKG